MRKRRRVNLITLQGTVLSQRNTQAAMGVEIKRLLLKNGTARSKRQAQGPETFVINAKILFSVFARTE